MDNNNSQDQNSNNSIFPQNVAPLETPSAPTALPSDPMSPLSTPVSTPVSTPAAPSNPWDQPLQSPTAMPASPGVMPQSPWPSSAQTETPSLNPTFPAPTNPMETSPFLQPQSPSSIPQPTDPISSLPAEPVFGAAPDLSQAPLQPFQLPQDPLNTAFSQTGAAPINNPFAQPQTPEVVPTPLPEAPNFMNTQPGALPAQNSGLNLDQSASLPISVGTSLPEAPGPSIPQDEQPISPTANINPVENAPTDLSHLIAGDEQAQPSDVYSPPIATDQNPNANPAQTPTEPGIGGPPPGKHLNLTKILLVAGIPILLVVAALSAYLILGIGNTKPAQQTTNQSSATTEQQAPLTNPPQQIIAPSPVPIPNTAIASLSPVSTASASQAPLSALEQLKLRQQSASSSSLPSN